jgi:membrane associated rhomboid family serine protease
MTGTSILEDLKYRFRAGNMVTKLIFVNVLVFVAVKLLVLILFFAQKNGLYTPIIAQLTMPAYLPQLVKQPWTIFTYMFLHEGFFHILFNMLWMFWFGDIFMLYLGDKKILPLYLLGGLSGAIFYVAAYNLIPVFHPSLPIVKMLGASAGVLAIVFAAVTLNPDYEVRLMFLGDVKIKYIALVSLVIDILSIPNGNAGGYIAHIGGALCGWLFIKGLRSGVDAGKPIGDFAEMVSSQFSKQKQGVLKYEGERKTTFGSATATTIKRTDDEQAQVDEILDKISRSGYDSLSKEEKDFLFKFSNK